jgi:hypothetical protein
MKRETFAEFLARNPEYRPVIGEMYDIAYQKKMEAFVVWCDEQIDVKIAEIDASLERNNITTA